MAEKDKKPKEKKEKSAYVFVEPVPEYISVKDSYLPHALVKIGLCENNAEARKYIRSVGVKLNGSMTNDTDATNESTNFELKLDGAVYLVILV